MKNKTIKKFRRGDDVMVISGKDKGKTGSILKIIPATQRLVVQGVNIVKRHTRPTQTNPGGVVEKEGSIHVSNIAHLDPDDNKPTRVGFKILEGSKKVRVAKRSGEMLD
ncbi:MAG: 50S ribosomal protein L24 [Pseudomonadota bacterium]|nr:50S ribosomal protein L24 [Pseudomonadota bacterium]